MSANNEMLHRFTAKSGANLNGQLYRLVKDDAAGGVVLSAAAGDFSLGVVAMDPQRSQTDTDSTAGSVVSVGMLSGYVPMVAEAAIPAGDLVHAGAAGGIVTAGGGSPGDATAGDFILGVCVDGAASGEVVRIFCQPVFVAA